MGMYVNPKDCSKEQWLKEHGEVTTMVEALQPKAGHLPVALVDNGPFTTAGIGFNSQEVERFIMGQNGRPLTWYSVPRDKLKEFM